MVRRELLGGSYRPIITEISKIALFLAEIPVNIVLMNSEAIRNPHKAHQNNSFNDLSGFNGVKDTTEKYLLLPRFDGDLKEGIVELVDLRNFQTLHTWNIDVDTVWDNLKKNNGSKWRDIFKDNNDKRYQYTHPLLLNDGSILFADNSPLIKINKKNKVVWIMDDEPYHHSKEQDIDGNIWVCVRYNPHKVDDKIVDKTVDNYYDDGIRKISPDGEIIFDKSMINIFHDNGMEYLLYAVGDRNFTYDPIHLNDIQPVNKDSKYWKKGDVFLSLRHQSMVILYRPSTNKIIWKSAGKFHHQHDVDILDDKRISIFDNNSKDFYNGDVVDGFNRIVIYDFETQNYNYHYNKFLEEQDVRTVTDGRSQILPNGDLMVEETTFGRILYFGLDGSLKWSYVNRAEDNYVYFISWSRILYEDNDINKVTQFLNQN